MTKKLPFVQNFKKNKINYIVLSGNFIYIIKLYFFMRKHLFIILCAVFLFSAQMWGQTWNLSPTMTAKLDSLGCLTISTTNVEGEAMPDYGWENIPWLSYQKSIKSLIINEGVSRIGRCSFFDCINLTSIYFPNTVTAIGNCSFAGCGGLISISIPNSVTSIESQAFTGCGNLTSVSIPNSVTYLEGPFSGCQNLLTINVALDHPEFSSEAGVLFNKNKTTLIQYPAGKTESSYKVPNSVTTIGHVAFQGCRNLTSVSFPNGLTTIQSMAFQNTSLSSLTIPNSVVLIIGGAFECYLLKDVTVGWATPLSVSNIFDGATKISDATLHVPAGTKELYAAADVWKEFGTIDDGTTDSGLSWQLTPTMTATLDSLGCLTISTTLAGGEAMPNYKFENGSWTAPWFYSREGYNITSVIIKNNITSIGNAAFSNCGNIISVSIPNSVKTIGEYAFYVCRKLASVTIPNSVITIGENAFSDCHSLSSLSIGDSVKSIGGDAFAYSKSLTSIIIPNSVESMGGYVFREAALTDVTVKWTTPLSVYLDLFDGVYTEEATLHVPAGTKALYQAADVWKEFGTIDDGTTSSCEQSWNLTATMTAVLDCEGVLTISTTLAEGEKMPDYTYEGTPWYSVRDKIISAVIEDNVTSIGSYTFCYSSNLTSVAIPNSVKSIGNDSFFGCEGLTSITIPVSVERIEDWAFWGCHGLTSVIIPTSVSSIGNYVFQLCKNLSSITIPRSVVSIGSLSFYGCTSLTDVIVEWPAPLSISKYTFDDVIIITKNATLHVPAGTKAAYEADPVWGTFGTIDDGTTPSCEKTFKLSETMTAVLDCEGVLTVSTTKAEGEDMPDYKLSLPHWYKNRLDISSVVFAGNVSNIGNGAFHSCSNLTSITIPNSIVSIGEKAFGLCSSLTNITIPSSVTAIDKDAFGHCTALTSFEVSWTTPLSVPYEFNLFFEVDLSAATLHVPAGTKALYEAADVWKEFGTIDDGTTEPEPDPTLAVSTTSLSFSADGGQQSLTITSNIEWTVSSSASWLAVSSASGSNNAVITTTAAANSTTNQRTATITISGTDVTSIIVNVTQEASTPELEPTLAVSTTSLNFIADGEQQVFSITSDTEWTVASSESWLTVSIDSGENDADIYVTAAANTSSSSRTAIITVSGTGVEEQTISVMQAGTDVISVISIALNYNTAELIVGDSLQLTAVITPENATNQAVNWTSSNTSIASVNETGLVIANSTGSALIIAKSVDGNKSDTCFVTVNEPPVVIPETEPVAQNGTGVIELSLSIPTDATLIGSFEIKFPQGMVLDEDLTALVPELAINFTIKITPKGDNTWLIDIVANGLRSLNSVEYRKIMDIAYKVEETVEQGSYEAVITNLDFVLDDETKIQEEELPVIIIITNDVTGISNMIAETSAYINNGRLHIQSPVAETVYIYSISGVLLNEFKKQAGHVDSPVDKSVSTILIVKGSSGWVKKVIYQQNI